MLAAVLKQKGCDQKQELQQERLTLIPFSLFSSETGNGYPCPCGSVSEKT